MALIEFKDLPDTTTPITASNLNNNFNECKVESGSNENGDWIKFADGTMICMGAVIFTGTVTDPRGALYAIGSIRHNFPQPFNGAGVHSIVVSPTAPLNMAYVNGYTTAYFDVTGLAYASLSESRSLAIHYMAIGRWK